MNATPGPIRVRILTLGCKVNQCDAEEIARALGGRGYEVARRGQAAEVYIVNTCTVTGTADAKARKLIRRIAREHPEAALIVTGCMAQRAPEAAALPGVTAVVPGTEKARLAEVVARLRPSPGSVVVSRPNKTRVFVKLQDGCDHRCAYCAVPDARGPMVSKPLAEAVAELARLAEAGTPEVVLCGIRLGAYGAETGSTSLAALLRETRGLSFPRLRLSSLEPMDVTEELLAELADHPTVCRHLHLPLQSGDDEVLAAMGRAYRRDEFARLLGRVRVAWPEAAITTDVIVGFPGETEEQFARSLAFLEEQRFSRVHVFPYSPRAGTPAAERPDLPAAAKTARAARMLALAERLAQEAAGVWVGRPVTILGEERDREGLITGLSEHYMRVRWASAEDAIGRFVTVVPTHARGGELSA